MLGKIFDFKSKKIDKKSDVSIIRFESGIIGFEFCKNFILKTVDNKNLKNAGTTIFVENLELEHIKFITLLPKISLGFTREEDIIQISEHLNVKRNDLLFLYIVTLSKTAAYINTKSPLVIDQKNKFGWQMILDKKYKLKQKIWSCNA